MKELNHEKFMMNSTVNMKSLGLGMVKEGLQSVQARRQHAANQSSQPDLRTGYNSKNTNNKWLNSVELAQFLMELYENLATTRMNLSDGDSTDNWL